MKIERINTGMLFKNDRKKQDTHADYTGSLNLNGEQFWVNAWVNTAKNGKKYFALRFAPKQRKLEVVNGPAAEFGDEVPF